MPSRSVVSVNCCATARIFWPAWRSRAGRSEQATLDAAPPHGRLAIKNMLAAVHFDLPQSVRLFAPFKQWFQSSHSGKDGRPVNIMSTDRQAALLKRFDRPVPRYTSYPTAPHFHEEIDGRSIARACGLAA